MAWAALNQTEESPDEEPGTALPKAGETVERKNWTWTVVDERGLAMGGGGLEEDDVRDLREWGFGAILNFRLESPEEQAHVEREGLEYLHIQVGHAEEDLVTIQEIETAVAFIERNLDAGRPVYVHDAGGWHQALIGPVAYIMKTEGLRFDEAYARVASLRPGVDPRFSESLLAYEAHLFGEPQLTIDLWTQRWDVLPNETVVVNALVTDRGQPVEGARLEFAADNGTLREQAVTDPQGRASFNFTSEGDSPVQFVHARAQKDGLVDGYDRNVFWIGKAAMRDPTVVEIGEWTPHVQPGERVALPVRVQEADGSAANARVTVTSPCWTFHRDYTGWDGSVAVAFDAPALNATYPLLIHVNRFPAEPVFERVELVVGSGGATPPCEPRASLIEPTESTPDAKPQSQSALTRDLDLEMVGKGVGFVAVALVLALGARSHRRK